MASGTLQTTSSRLVSLPNASVVKVSIPTKRTLINFRSNGSISSLTNNITTHAVSRNGSISSCASNMSVSSLKADENRRKSNLESLFCYDKAIPEEIIEKPVGLSLTEKDIGNNPRCTDCEAKGAVLCITCAGSGLYVDSILESQGIIVKVRCLGCGGTGNMMCTECGGRGHLGPK
ncbi:hypothetical protein HN51_041031 [Arachis hypogaea]|uniref:uncharacterized protein n=1 Tax=Arachis hypogaea TaxID=3818 RepID=UPI0007AF2622|nr:uncharacterized protein LOC107604783 isoform X1 [Arachis ipaensis]XP_025658289.1 protein PHOTOSYSTEM I ASSEMBLY 2, chloroplastic isoform X1 [Arachis hypogaea]XP_025658290.1 protein PHOTOSYSTEM I ASSEMBLY 2, chloroplastic isoform X1 [Arachis hypogaea]XP_025658291.1 protein PHOTOSYSTEM I ASSEMBLY 2, chloroplastic isoform X1 [Arachis hypogaea]XP_025658292.1 protein PHOTOSYSTEM I ASSEMBLY 2, chloroplastic isoform X1 [Arachis hypogaea]QHN86724.1 uncharacterized protein DS421_16g548690 [Arachis h